MTWLYCLGSFLLGMAALPVGHAIWELAVNLREHWVRLDFYDTARRREHTPVMGRAIHRLMRVLKPAGPVESEFARKLRVGECICGGPRADGMHDSTCPVRCAAKETR